MNNNFDDEQALGEHSGDSLEDAGDSLEDAQKELGELLEDLESSENYSGEIFNGEGELWEDGEQLLENQGEHLSETGEDPLLSGLQESSLEEEDFEEEEYEEEEEDDFDFEDEEDDFDEDDLDPNNWEQGEQDELTDELQGAQEPPNAAEQLEEAMEYSPFMGQLGQLAMEKADLWRANLCAHISGQHVAMFVSGKRELELLKTAVKDYLRHLQVGQPSPFIQLMLAISYWALPSLLMAYFMRPKKQTSTASSAPPPKATKAAASTMQVVQKEPVYDSAYKHLKEYQEGRTSFKVHSSKAKPIGAYQYGPDGKNYRNVELADEEPSPVIAAWLAEGRNNSFIKAQLYGQ